MESMCDSPEVGEKKLGARSESRLKSVERMAYGHLMDDYSFYHALTRRARLPAAVANQSDECKPELAEVCTDANFWASAKLRRTMKPTQVRKLRIDAQEGEARNRLRAQDTPSLVISATCVSDPGRFVLSHLDHAVSALGRFVLSHSTTSNLRIIGATRTTLV